MDPREFELLQRNKERAEAAYVNECARPEQYSGIGGGCAAPRSEADIVAELFRYHAPNDFTIPKFAAINQAAKNFAEVILANCPPGSDRSSAIGAVRMTRMLANAAIALGGLSLY